MSEEKIHYFAVKGVGKCGLGIYSNEAEVFVKGRPGFPNSSEKVELIEGFGEIEEEGEVAGISITKNKYWYWILLIVSVGYFLYLVNFPLRRQRKS